MICPDLLNKISLNLTHRNLIRVNRLFSLPHHRTNYAMHSPVERTLRAVNSNGIEILGISLGHFKNLIRNL